VVLARRLLLYGLGIAGHRTFVGPNRTSSRESGSGIDGRTTHSRSGTSATRCSASATPADRVSTANAPSTAQLPSGINLEFLDYLGGLSSALFLMPHRADAAILRNENWFQMRFPESLVFLASILPVAIGRKSLRCMVIPEHENDSTARGRGGCGLVLESMPTSSRGLRNAYLNLLWRTHIRRSHFTTITTTPRTPTTAIIRAST